jgi:hypothetical protein
LIILSFSRAFDRSYMKTFPALVPKTRVVMF